MMRTRRLKAVALGAVAAALLILGPIAQSHFAAGTPARSEETPRPTMPTPPADGTMGFVVAEFVAPVVPGMDACPHGTAPRLREEYLRTLPDADQARLRLKANEQELTSRWHGYAFGPNGTNICSQPDSFQHTAYPGVESRFGWGLHLADKGDATTCAHDTFQTPLGEQGVDNQEYRATGCTLEMRGVDGSGGDALTGMQQFHTSGQWTQVLLLKGVHSFVHQDNVEVIYANTADRPMLDSKGHFLPGLSFAVNDTGARHRNVLHGRIDNYILTTEPTDIKLAQTWGQGGPRDIRGNRTTYLFHKGRLRLEFQPDGSLRGLVGGYQNLFDVIASTSLGGEGAATVAGIDCSAEMAALKKYADGMRDPKTGQCTAVSSAMRIGAIPAFVTDLPDKQRITAR